MITRNKDGQQNLRELRAELAKQNSIRVEREGGNWLIKRLTGGAWHITTCPYYFGERQAIQRALEIDVESASEAKACANYSQATNSN